MKRLFMGPHITKEPRKTGLLIRGSKIEVGRVAELFPALKPAFFRSSLST